MGTWDEYCVVCGCGIIITEIENKELYELMLKQKWITKCIGIDQNNKKYSGIYDGYGNIIVNGTPMPMTDGKNKLLIVCHADCFKLLKQTLNYNFNFNKIAKLMSPSLNLLKVSYALNKRSYSQFWNYAVLNYDDIQTPLKNNKNKKRIIGIWKKLIS